MIQLIAPHPIELANPYEETVSIAVAEDPLGVVIPHDPTDEIVVVVIALAILEEPGPP